MKNSIVVFLLTANVVVWSQVHPVDRVKMGVNPYNGDWLVGPISQKAVIAGERDGMITLHNGLVKRTFRLFPNVACTEYLNLTTGQQLLRSVKPEAEITIDGVAYNVGGLYGQKEQAYLLPQWLDSLTSGQRDFKFTGYTITELKPAINWSPGSWWTANKKHATGKTISFTYQTNVEELKGVRVAVFYTIYDGLPLISKWLTIKNEGPKPVKINRIKNS